jgi:hypothetical protein
MSYSIKHERLMNVMDKFFNETLPYIELPLVKKNKKGEGNRVYGSGLDDYIYINTYYYSQENLEEPLFINFDDNYSYSDVKWEITDRLTQIFDFFGEENFQEFIKWKFGFDITRKGTKKWDYVFR